MKKFYVTLCLLMLSQLLAAQNDWDKLMALFPLKTAEEMNRIAGPIDFPEGKGINNQLLEATLFKKTGNASKNEETVFGSQWHSFSKLVFSENLPNFSALISCKSVIELRQYLSCNMLIPKGKRFSKDTLILTVENFQFHLNMVNRVCIDIYISQRKNIYKSILRYHYKQSLTDFGFSGKIKNGNSELKIEFESTHFNYQGFRLNDHAYTFYEDPKTKEILGVGDSFCFYFSKNSNIIQLLDGFNLEPYRYRIKFKHEQDYSDLYVNNTGDQLTYISAEGSKQIFKNTKSIPTQIIGYVKNNFGQRSNKYFNLLKENLVFNNFSVFYQNLADSIPNALSEGIEETSMVLDNVDPITQNLGDLLELQCMIKGKYKNEFTDQTFPKYPSFFLYLNYQAGHEFYEPVRLYRLHSYPNQLKLLYISKYFSYEWNGYEYQILTIDELSNQIHVSKLFNNRYTNMGSYFHEIKYLGDNKFETLLLNADTLYSLVEIYKCDSLKEIKIDSFKDYNQGLFCYNSTVLSPYFVRRTKDSIYIFDVSENKIFNENKEKRFTGVFIAANVLDTKLVLPWNKVAFYNLPDCILMKDGSKEIKMYKYPYGYPFPLEFKEYHYIYRK